MENKYVKIVYQTEPIGKERIILYLTTFDIEKYQEETQFKAVECEIPMSIDRAFSGTEKQAFFNYLEHKLNKWVENFYEPYINEAKDLTQAIKYKKEFCQNLKGDVVNVASVRCNTIRGDVVNCGEVICREIDGDITNCRVVYENIETRKN